MQNVTNIFGPLEDFWNSHSIFFSSTHWGKKATTPRSSRAFGSSSLSIGYPGDGSIVATATTTNGPVWSQSEVPNRTAMIWRVSGGCSLKAHSQTMFKGRHTGEPTVNTRDDFDEGNITAQKHLGLHDLQLGACWMGGKCRGRIKARSLPSLKYYRMTARVKKKFFCRLFIPP